MTEWMHLFTALSACATGALVSAMWQGAILTVAVALCLRLFPGLTAAARSVIWMNVFVLLAMLHFVPAFAHPAAQIAGEIPSVQLDLRWSLAVAVLWLALSVWKAVQLVTGAWHLRQLAHRAVPIAADPELQAILNDVPRGRAAQLCASTEIARPSVLGFFHPRVLVPPVLVDRLSKEELRQVVLHEMEHLRRADDWTNLLQKIALVLFPLNPVLLWVERRLCAERELACDDRVMSAGAGRKAYALCLTHLAEFALLKRGFSLVLGAFERRPELVRRVQRILSRPAHSMGRKAALLTTGGVLSGALACALLLARSPQVVSFGPAATPFQASRLSDAAELRQELGGSPQLVKAVVAPPHSSAQPAEKAVLTHTVRRKTRANRAVPRPLQMASRPEPQVREAMFVVTQWTDIVPAQRLVISVVHERATQDPQSAPAVVVPAIYATLPTPDGWIILQI